MGSNKQIPKRAFTKPKASHAIFLIVILIFFTTNSAFAGLGQFVIFVFSLPLIIPGFFCSYYSGLSLAKLSYDRIKNGKVLLIFMWLAIFQLIVIGVCFLIEIRLAGGYPIRSCVDFCSVIKSEQIFISYFVVSTVILAPAYYAIYRYSVWVNKHNIKSIVKNIKKNNEENMKQILIATTNPGKIMTAKKILAKLGYEGLSFADLGLKLEEPEETKLTAEEIAAEKALGYAKQFKDMPVLARDDTNVLVGVDEEDDPKNHNKEFVVRKAGEYSDENGEKVFAEIAHKYGGELPTRFDWGYALAWHDGDEIKVVSALATTGTERTKIVDKISPKKVPGFCFAPILKVLIDGEWKYDSELSDEDSWKAYWNIQAETINGLIEQCDWWDK